MSKGAALKIHVDPTKPTADGERPSLEDCIARGRRGRDQDVLDEVVRRYGGDLAAELAAIEAGTHPAQERKPPARR
jgi:hypothetical protein